MSDITFPALVGDSPLAILAAIGTLRLIHDFIDEEACLSWDSDTHAPMLTSSCTSLEEIVNQLRQIVNDMPDGVIVPGGPVCFPPPGRAPDKLRVQQGELAGLVNRFALDSVTAPVVQTWVSSLVTDLAVDKDKRGAITQFAAPAGQQTMATMLDKPLECVRKDPDCLRQALVGWRRVSGVTGEYLDHRASWASSEDGIGKSTKPMMRGVPGATWLALMSYPLWTTTVNRGSVCTSGWHSVKVGRRTVYELRLPLWRESLAPAAVKALVEHPTLDGPWDEIDLEDLRVLGVIDVCRARRRQSRDGKSAGVLVPLRTGIRVGFSH
ncbi:MAG: hypothetical protein Q4C87_07475 [Actinomycetaceae bacterium]|nr:hypothetical protein [Actinomycetaceae bacterium]